MSTLFVQLASVLIDHDLSRLNSSRSLSPRCYALSAQLEKKHHSETFINSSSVNNTKVALRNSQSRFVPPTMAPNQSNPRKNSRSKDGSGQPPAGAAAAAGDEPPRIIDSMQPSAVAYGVKPHLTLSVRNLPYRKTGTGLGIALDDTPSVVRVYANASGDRARFSDPSNAYGLKIIAMIIANMRKVKAQGVQGENGQSNGSAKKGKKAKVLNRVGERDSFELVMKKEAKRLATAMGFDPTEANQRQNTAMWTIMTGFNKDVHDDADSALNEHLNKLLLNYAQVRVGQKPCPGDELQSAMYAMQVFYQEKESSMKHTLETGTFPSWTLPMVFMLNDHMKARNMTPIAFSENGEDDDLARNQLRSKHSKEIWVKTSDGSTKAIKVETRRSVVNEFKEFATEVHGEDLPNIPACVGPPKMDDDDGALELVPRVKRVRRSINYN